MLSSHSHLDTFFVFFKLRTNCTVVTYMPDWCEEYYTSEAFFKCLAFKKKYFLVNHVEIASDWTALMMGKSCLNPKVCASQLVINISVNAQTRQMSPKGTTVICDFEIPATLGLAISITLNFFPLLFIVHISPY